MSPSAVGTKRKGKGRILFGNMMRMRLMSKTVSQRLVVLSVRGMAGRMGGYAPLPGKASSSDSWMRLLVGNAANLRKRCLSNPFASCFLGWPVKTIIHNPYLTNDSFAQFRLIFADASISPKPSQFCGMACFMGKLT